MLILTREELIDLTGREQPAAQRRVLDAMGVPYQPHPFDGSLKVARAAVEKWLGVASDKPANEEFAVDIEGLASHGKKTTKRGS